MTSLCPVAHWISEAFVPGLPQRVPKYNRVVLPTRRWFVMEERDFRVVLLIGGKEDTKELNEAGAEGFSLVQIANNARGFLVAYLQRPRR